MKAIDFLKIRKIGTDDQGAPVYSERSIRGFLIALLVGTRGVAMNVVSDGNISIRHPGECFFIDNSHVSPGQG